MFYFVCIAVAYRMTAKPPVFRLDKLRDIVDGPRGSRMNASKCILGQKERYISFIHEADHAI